MKRNFYLGLLSPLMSTFILMNALGLFSTFLPLHLETLGATNWSIGFVTASYYLGMALGSFRNAALILRIGHIRAFAALTCITTVAILANGLYDTVLSCIILRGVMGYCLAGLYIVIESWILKVSDLKSRGKALSLYMVALYGASASGQFLLGVTDLATLQPFLLIGLLAVLSIFPLAITKVGTPQIGEPSAMGVKELFKLSPSGLIACATAGIVYSSTLGFMPLYIRDIIANPTDVGLMMFCMLIGGMLMQYPVGRWSDQFDRRTILIALCVVLVISSAFILVGEGYHPYVMGLLLFLFGGASFSLYPVSISHTCDMLTGDDIIAVTQGLVLVYGFGAVVGPLITPYFLTYFAMDGLFVLMMFMGVLLAIYLVSRIGVQAPAPLGSHEEYVPMPNTTPIAAELNPRADENKK